ncbi:protein tyrosine phosphatase-like domain-containing protein [Acetobacter pasteurianus]|nr:protein tyrosine phosphatase-like domain-containing protein [Acetobacter pasteurianus]
MKIYLLAYNGLSAGLWLYILFQCITNIQRGYFLYKSGGDEIPHSFMLYTQIFNSLFELAHSVTGLVPSPIPTLLLQSFARLIILVGICYVIPESPANYALYTFSGLTLAWSITEIIRYGYYFLKLSQKAPASVPYSITWLRYSAFFILYPLGLVCESLTVYRSYAVIEHRLPYYSKFLKYALPLYIPGFVYLYSYMISQRRKVLKKEKAKLV